jgi:hypothetical protein
MLAVGRQCGTEDAATVGFSDVFRFLTASVEPHKLALAPSGTRSVNDRSHSRSGNCRTIHRGIDRNLLPETDWIAGQLKTDRIERLSKQRRLHDEQQMVGRAELYSGICRYRKTLGRR